MLSGRLRGELLRVSGSAPRHAIRALLLMRGDPLLYIHLFIDSVGVMVLYRRMAIDSFGVMALYIHGDLCFPSGFAVSFCGCRVRRPGMRFEPYFLMRGGPLLYIHLFVDSVGVTVLYRQMAVDSVGVTALYIHGDLGFPSGFARSFCGCRGRRPGMRFEPYFSCVVTPFCIYTCLLIRLGLWFCIDKLLLIRLELRRCIYTGDLCFPSGFAVSFCGCRVRRPGMRFEPYFLCVVTPFCIYTC